jgi:hypothetical protein
MPFVLANSCWSMLSHVSHRVSAMHSDAASPTDCYFAHGAASVTRCSSLMRQLQLHVALRTLGGFDYTLLFTHGAASITCCSFHIWRLRLHAALCSWGSFDYMLLFAHGAASMAYCFSPMHGAASVTCCLSLSRGSFDDPLFLAHAAASMNASIRAS